MRDEEVVEKVREKVIEICKNSNDFLKDNYNIHIRIVEDLALRLGKKFNADLKILQLSALLHDIGRIKYGDEGHEKTGAKEAEKILRDLGEREDTIEKVKECILLHRHSDPTIPESIEAKLLKIADAWSHFYIPLELVAAFSKMFNKSAREAVKLVSEKLRRDLDFLRKASTQIEIEEVLEDCERCYNSFISLIRI